ncbi:MAG: LysM peptidoglycan-binding domain-containing protein [Phycisphaerales bacterium]|nr:MAG: LysM peptidoglycan-binding domain-containing protein [Phycisphaerales bacterium]
MNVRHDKDYTLNAAVCSRGESREERKMAQETKIALVVGLGFIVCFALVLANRGQPAPAALTLPGRTAGADAPAVAAVRTMPQGVASAPAPGPFGASAAPPTDPLASSTPPLAGSLPETASVAAATESSGIPAPPAAPSLTPATPIPSSDPVTPPVRTADASRSGLPPALAGVVVPVRPMTPPPGGAPAEPRHAPVPSGLARPDTAVGKPAQFYEVQPGDTLYAIAGRVYGTPSARVVAAIYEANQAVMPGPDRIKAGQRLTLPALPDVLPSAPPPTPASDPALVLASAPAPTPASDPARFVPQAPPPREPSEPGPYRWYQIKKSDRYVSIARDQLGDERRWREIYELNKDKFPDPDRIRDGVRIRLPAAALADGRERRP